jgi:hypothetical protein
MKSTALTATNSKKRCALSIKPRAKIQSENKLHFKKPTAIPFQHPYDSPHHPLNFSSVKNAELFHDLVGPEQVSPHYENFMMARKWAIGFWVGVFVISFGANSGSILLFSRSTLDR